MFSMTEKTYPAWAEPCNWFIDYLVQVEILLALASRGISTVTQFPDLYRKLKPYDNDPEKDATEHNLNSLREVIKLAESEIANDFPLLRSHSIIGVWGALEAMIEDLAIAWMEQNPSVLDGPNLAKIRVPFVQFHRLDQQERLRFVVTELQRELRVELKSGATKFELLLGTLGLGGPVDERVRDILFETQNLRNVFAHRGGIADRRFVANCPHLQYSAGDRIRISSEHFQRILHGLLMYSATILNRCRAIAGMRVITEDIAGFEGVLSFPDERLFGRVALLRPT
jgi:hypothetical protein